MLKFMNLQVPFPLGVDLRSRPGKARSGFVEENHRGSSPGSVGGGGGGSSSNGLDALTGPVKDSN